MTSMLYSFVSCLICIFSPFWFYIYLNVVMSVWLVCRNMWFLFLIHNSHIFRKKISWWKREIYMKCIFVQIWKTRWCFQTVYWIFIWSIKHLRKRNLKFKRKNHFSALEMNPCKPKKIYYDRNVVNIFMKCCHYPTISVYMAYHSMRQHCIIFNIS